MITKTIKASEIQKDWYVADADGKVLGRFASEIAQILRGKHKPNFSPNMDMGDFVVVINAEKVKVTGNKETDKIYFRHSGYPGGTTFTSLSHLRRTYPERIIENAVKGMLPKNKLGSAIMKHLKIYAGAVHPHTAQQPKKLDI
jgi:large subunit ribosomal protein L13